MNMNFITHISDTHDYTKHLNIKPTYLLVHSGDATSKGNLTAMTVFANWFAKQPAIYKIFVPGNHDRNYFERHAAACYEEFRMRGIHLLINDSIEVGDIKIHGVGCLARPQSYLNIPTDRDIIVTHEPPFKILDKMDGEPRVWDNPEGHLGIPELTKLNCKLHLFGHIHEQRGYKKINNILHVNGACLDRSYTINREETVIDAVVVNGRVNWDSIYVKSQ